MDDDNKEEKEEEMMMKGEGGGPALPRVLTSLSLGDCEYGAGVY